MPPGEVDITCEGCGSRFRLPISALKRANSYCSNCGRKLPAAEVPAYSAADAARSAAPKRKPYRSTKRR